MPYPPGESVTAKEEMKGHARSFQPQQREGALLTQV